jgi:hypothetical protein
MRRRKVAIDDALLSGGGILVLLATLVALDNRVRDHVFGLFGASRSGGELASASDQLRELGVVIFQAVHDQSIEHAPLVIFTLVAAVLVLFMLRT